MAKSKKKRSKAYTGSDAKNARPQVVRINAVSRSKFGQWRYEHRKQQRPILIAAGIVILLVIMVIGIIGIVTSS